MLTLSEAIRLGAMIRPQGYGSFVRDGASCALGAAAEACGIGADDFEAVGAMWPWTLRRIFTIEFISGHDWSHQQCLVDAREVIWRLNDVHGWTRERIADYVELLEKRLECVDAVPAQSELVQIEG